VAVIGILLAEDPYGERLMAAAERTESNKIKKVTIWPLLGAFRSVVFFVLFYLYLAFEVDLRLIYHGGGLIDNFPTFYWGWDFLIQYLAYPGGMVQYASAFLAQLFYYSWAGAAVVTCQAWLIWLGTDVYLKAVAARRLRWIRFIGPLVLAAIYSQYTFHLPMTVAFTAALLGACLFLRFAPQAAVPRGLCFLVLSVVLYAGAGGAFLLFAFLCGAAEIVFGRQYRRGLLYWALGAALPCLLGVVVFGDRPADAYGRLLPWFWQTIHDGSSKRMLNAVVVLDACLPLAVSILGIWRFLSSGWRQPPPQARPARGGHRLRRADPSPAKGATGALAWGLETAALAVLTAATLLIYHDSRQKNLFEVDYSCMHRMWSKVLDIGRRSPHHYLISHAIYRALYHTGQLGDSMFSYPPDAKALLLTGKEVLWQKIDTCIDLGLMNEAENALTISVEVFGERPILLERLALVNMVKGNINPARVLLGALAKVPFWRTPAQDYLARIERDPNLSQDEEIQSLRALRLKRDSVKPIDIITQLLTENKKNRMAYEYGVAWLLLTKNLAGFAQSFNLYHDASAPSIPRHHEEAILLCKTLKQGGVDLRGQSVSQETLNRLAAFTKAIRPYGKDAAAARAALKEDFGDSYFYYFFLSGSGAQ